MGLGFAGKAGRRSGARPFGEGGEILFHKPLARPLDGVQAGRHLLGNFIICQPVVSFQQNTSACHLSSSSFASPDEAQKRIPLFRR
jgi:hypothetical protein